MKNEQIQNISSGINELDGLTSGFKHSDLIIIGGRPSSGKTGLVLSMLKHISINKRIPAAFFSLELSKTAVINRLSQSLSAQTINEAPIYIVDTPAMKISDICSQAIQLKAQEKIEIIFIEYLGLIQIVNDKAPYHEQQMEISKSLKNLALELSVPVVVLAQLNRSENDPVITDIRGSQDVERIADIILFLFKNKSDRTKLRIMKNRNAEICEIEITF